MKQQSKSSWTTACIACAFILAAGAACLPACARGPPPTNTTTHVCGKQLTVVLVDSTSHSQERCRSILARLATCSHDNAHPWLGHSRTRTLRLAWEQVESALATLRSTKTHTNTNHSVHPVKPRCCGAAGNHTLYAKRVGSPHLGEGTISDGVLLCPALLRLGHGFNAGRCVAVGLAALASRRKL